MGGNGSLWSEEKWSVCQRLGLSPKQGAARDGCAGRRRKKRIISSGAIHEGNTGEGASRSENLGLHFRRVRRLGRPRTEASSDK